MQTVSTQNWSRKKIDDKNNIFLDITHFFFGVVVLPLIRWKSEITNLLKKHQQSLES